MGKPTVRDLIEAKGRRKLVLTTAFDRWTAAAAEAAGVDMILAWGGNLEHTRWVLDAVCSGAPNTLIGTGLPLAEAYSSEDAALRLAGEVQAMGADIIYCSGLVPERFTPLCRQKYPCCGHVGYLPVQNTWFGGPRAVGKTSEEALKVLDDVLALQDAGVIGVEMECVPSRVAAEITRRTDILVFSMGSGPDCDGQFLFTEDLLGTNTGHYPRHSRTYTRFFDEAVKALTRYREDVESGAYPEARHTIRIQDQEFDRFMELVEQRTA
jgi:3-methyl-2-oxobutanoate hydroxymethyltransferase